MSDVKLAAGIHMIVETEGDELKITEGDFTPHDKVVLIQYLVSSLHNMSGIPYNEILDDLKLVEEPITEVKKSKKKKKERK